MNIYYYTVIKQRPLYTSTEADAFPVAEVAFWAEVDSLADRGFIFDAAHTLGLGQTGANIVSELFDEAQLTALPNTLSPDKPDWSDATHKLWVLRRLVP